MSKTHKKITLDNDIIIKMIKENESSKKLGKSLKKYYDYLKTNQNN